LITQIVRYNRYIVSKYQVTNVLFRRQQILINTTEHYLLIIDKFAIQWSSLFCTDTIGPGLL